MDEYDLSRQIDVLRSTVEGLAVQLAVSSNDVDPGLDSRLEAVERSLQEVSIDSRLAGVFKAAQLDEPGAGSTGPPPYYLQ